MLIDMKKVKMTERKFLLGHEMTDPELKALSNFYSSMEDYFSEDRIVRMHYRNLFYRVNELIDAIKQETPREGTFAHLVEFAKARGIIVERAGRRIEWWDKDLSSAVGVCDSVKQAFDEISNYSVVKAQ